MESFGTGPTAVTEMFVCSGFNSPAHRLLVSPTQRCIARLETRACERRLENARAIQERVLWERPGFVVFATCANADATGNNI